FRARSGDLRAPRWFSDLLREAENSSGEYIRVDHKKVNTHVNRWLSTHRDKIIRRLLNHDKATIGSIKLHLHHDLFIKRGGDKPEELSSIDLTLNDWTLAYSNTPPRERSGGMASSPGSKPEDILYSEIKEHILFGKSFNGSQYIPATRSGLLL